MAPFTIYPHHPLSYQCHLPQTAPYRQSKMDLELSSNTSGTPQDLPLGTYRRMSVFSMLLKIRLHLWQVIQRVLNCCMSVTELSSNMFLFICVGKSTAMMGQLKKNGVVEAQERPGGEFMSGILRSVGLDTEIKDPVMELDDEELTTPAESEEWSVDDSEEEDEGQLSEWESEEETDDEEEDDEEQPPHEETECDDDVDSDWSDDDDDDEDSEASAESLELWESFFNSSDPYNPLSFSSCTGSRTNTSTNKNQMTTSSKIKQTEPTPAINKEEHYSKPSTKKVCFSVKVTVRPLVAWSFASRAARDGSCWMRMARDRERFRRRAASVEKIITPCFTPEHRADVWKRLQRETRSV